MQSITAFDSRVVALVSHIAGTRALRMLRHIDESNDVRIGASIPSSVNSVADVVFEAELCNEHSDALSLSATTVLEMIESEGIEEFDRCIRRAIFAAVADRLIHDAPVPTDILTVTPDSHEVSEFSLTDGARSSIACRYQKPLSHQKENESGPFIVLKQSINKAVSMIQNNESEMIVAFLNSLPTSKADVLHELCKFSSKNLRVLANEENVAGVTSLVDFLNTNGFQNVAVESHRVHPLSERGVKARFNRWYISSDSGGIRTFPRVVFVTKRSERSGDINFILGTHLKVQTGKLQFADMIAMPPMP